MAHSLSILHIDGDDFFASLFRNRNPKLKKRPLIIGHLQSRGYVTAASYEARQSGVHRGLTVMQAKRLCPDANLEQIDWALIRRASTTLNGHIRSYSPQVEQSGIDSFFMDYTGCEQLFGKPSMLASKLQREIRDDLKVGVSVGLSADKAVSAVACRAAKLGRFQDVRPGEEQSFLNGCPLEWLPGITEQHRKRFKLLGIVTIDQLASIPEEVLIQLLGIMGRTLSIRARGLEHALVQPCRRRDEPSVSYKFPEDILDRSMTIARLAQMAGLLGTILRQRHRSTRYLNVRIGFADGVVVSKQDCLDYPTHCDPDIFRGARKIFHRLDTRRVRIRELVLQARHMIYCPSELPLGPDAIRRMRWDQILCTADTIRHRFPQNPFALTLGSARVVN